MIKFNYTLKALAPVHTGADSNLGTLRQLRREKVFLRNPQPILSRFKPEQRKLKRQALALLLLRLWQKMENKNRFSIYDEVAGKLLSAASLRNKEELLNRLCERLEIRQITSKPDGHFDIIDLLELFTDEELMSLIRDEHQYVMAVFRKLKDETTEYFKTHAKKAKTSSITLFDSIDAVTGELNPVEMIEAQLMDVQYQPLQETGQYRSSDYVPVISGNSVRGMLRRVVMADFCDQLGLTAIPAPLYHQLFTGGILNAASDYEDIGGRQAAIRRCPMLGLFGSAMGNQMIAGDLRVGQVNPVCREKGFDGPSYHEYLDVLFNVRHDTEKLERRIEVTEQGDAETHMMFFEYEVFAPGTPFSHSFACTADNPLIVSAFWRMLKLFLGNNYLCAKSSIGNGEVDLSELAAHIPADGDRLYLEHLQQHHEEIVAHFSANAEVSGV